MFSVSQVQASSSAINDKVHSAEADIKSNLLQLFKCMSRLKPRDIEIEQSEEANDVLEKYFNKINERSDVIQEAIDNLIVELTS